MHSVWLIFMAICHLERVLSVRSVRVREWMHVCLRNYASGHVPLSKRDQWMLTFCWGGRRRATRALVCIANTALWFLGSSVNNRMIMNSLFTHLLLTCLSWNAGKSFQELFKRVCVCDCVVSRSSRSLVKMALGRWWKFLLMWQPEMCVSSWFIRVTAWMTTAGL